MRGYEQPLLEIWSPDRFTGDSDTAKLRGAGEETRAWIEQKIREVKEQLDSVAPIPFSGAMIFPGESDTDDVCSLSLHELRALQWVLHEREGLKQAADRLEGLQRLYARALDAYHDEKGHAKYRKFAHVMGATGTWKNPPSLTETYLHLIESGQQRYVTQLWPDGRITEYGLPKPTPLSPREAFEVLKSLYGMPSTAAVRSELVRQKKRRQDAGERADYRIPWAS